MTEGLELKSIAVAGAGISGLSAAIALKLAGLSVRVFEREASLEAIGAGIQLGPNATRILKSWGMPLPSASFEPQRIELRNARSGALLNSIPLREAAQARYAAPYATLLRADLQAALLGRARDLGIEVNFGRPVTEIETAASGLRVRAGAGWLEAGALIGADGLRSAVRKLVGLWLEPYSAQAVAWRAALPLTAVSAPLRDAIVVWMAPGAHLVHYAVSGGAALNAVLIVEDGRAKARADKLAYLFYRLRGWASLPRGIVASSEAWEAWPINAVLKSDGGSGRVQIIGDAWHAMTPYLASGAVMAIEDAAALAGSLTATGNNIEAGLAHFRKRRGPRVWRVAHASARMGRIYHCPQPFDALRDMAIKAATGPMLLARNDWLYDARP